MALFPTGAPKENVATSAAYGQAVSAHDRVNDLTDRLKALEATVRAQAIQIETLKRACIEAGAVTPDQLLRFGTVVAGEMEPPRGSHPGASPPPRETVDCPACGKPNRKTAKRCMICGEDMPASP
jgi:hypothetical protein